MKAFHYVGERDDYQGTIIECVDSHDGCDGCFFNQPRFEGRCAELRCTAEERIDGHEVIYQRVGKVKQNKKKVRL